MTNKEMIQQRIQWLEEHCAHLQKTVDEMWNDLETLRSAFDNEED